MTDNRLVINVSFDPARGYTSQACPALNRSFTALSLSVLKKRIQVAAAMQRRADTPVVVELELDRAAGAERDKRRYEARV
jgi:hypothetical protein